MSTRSVPIAEGAELASGAEAVGALLGSAPAPGHVLPCRQDPDRWFAESPAELERAKSLCAECPVKAQCLAGALERAEPWGVWGGEILDRGAVVARKRPRGRPRKHPVPQHAGSGTERVA